MEGKDDSVGGDGREILAPPPTYATVLHSHEVLSGAEEASRSMGAVEDSCQLSFGHRLELQRTREAVRLKLTSSPEGNAGSSLAGLAESTT